MAPPKRKGGRTLPATGSATVSTGRVTKKVTDAARIADDEHAHHSIQTSSRYTPPTPKMMKISPPWVPVLMGVLLGAGALMIVLNYLNVLPGATNNGYLLGGLGLILSGIVTATQWR
jgi:hypothetical protein